MELDRKERKEVIGDPSKLVYTMDLEAVMLRPLLKASALYYKTKLAVHNFTVFSLANKMLFFMCGMKGREVW